MTLKTYETICILNPNLSGQDVENQLKTWQQVITDNGGEIKRVSRWGKKKLAYPVKKFNQGIFMVLHYTSSGEIVDELERRFKISDQVIRFQTISLTPLQERVSQATLDKMENLNVALTAETETAESPTPEEKEDKSDDSTPEQKTDTEKQDMESTQPIPDPKVEKSTEADSGQEETTSAEHPETTE